MPNDNIDERVVEMRIDNRQFVAGAEKTIGILDRLKEALSFKNADDGFEAIQKSAYKLNLSGIAENVGLISDRFTTLGLVGQRVIQNLTDSVSRFVFSTARGLVVDPVAGGFGKYEDILRSTQTIMSATRNEIVPKEFSSQLEYVSGQIEALAWYTDETSYNLQDMVSNVGKFTSAGIPLKDSVTYMQGITNWAAAAGASTQEASRAMYNLSQAMSVGVVKLQDWRSIENANMATLEFKQTVLEAAVAMGTLKKNADGTYKTIKGNTKVTATNFNETLQKGWFTKQVLEKSLSVYGEYSNRLGAVMKDMGLSDAGLAAADVMEQVDALNEKVSSGTINTDQALLEWQQQLTDYYEEDSIPSIEQLRYAYELLTGDEDALADRAAALGQDFSKLSAEEFELSKRAFLMGQQYRTFADVISATKDAVSTKWMETFQLIIGNAEQATEVWTKVGGVFYEIFAEGAARRNAILKWWNSPGEGIKSGRDSFLKAIANVYEAVRTYIDPIIEAFDAIFSWGPAKTAGEKLREITYAIENFTEKLGLSKKAKDGMTNFFKSLFGTIQKLLGVFRPFLNLFGDAIVVVRDFVNLFFESFESGNFDKDYFLAGLPGIFGSISESVSKAWESLKKFSDELKDIPIIGTIASLLKNVFSLIGKAFSYINDFFSGRSFFDVLREKVEAIRTWMSPIFDWIQEKYNLIKDSISNLFSGDGLGFKKILSIFAGLAALRVGKGMFDWFKFDLSLVTKPLQSVLEFFGDLDDAVFSFTNETRIKAIKQLAVSLLILAASLVVLSLVDSDKLAISLVTLAGGLVELIGALAALKFIKPKGAIRIASLLIALSVSILIFSAALLVLSKIDTDSLVNALGAAFFMLVMIFAFVAAVSLLKVKPRTVSGIISLAVAMLIFTGVIYLLGSIPYKKLEQGLIALAASLIIVSAAMLLLSSAGGLKMLAAGIGMVFLATSIIILVGALALLTMIDFDKATKSLLLLAGALAIVAVAALVMPATLPLIGIGLIAVAVAIAIISGVLIALSYIDADKLANSLMIMGIALIGLAAILVAMTTAIPGAIALLIASVAMVVVAGAIVVLSVALNILKGLPLKDIAAGLAILGAALIALAVGLVFMTVGLFGAIALIAASAALVILSFAMKMLTGLDLFGIAGGLAVLGLAFIPLGIGGLVLGLGAAGIIAGAVAIGLMGLAMIPFAESLEKLSGISFNTICDYMILLGGTAGALALLTPVLGPLAIAVAAFGVACLAAGEGINLAGDGMVKISESILSIPDNIKQIFLDSVKAIKDSVTEFIPAGEEVVAVINDIGSDMSSALHTALLQMAEMAQADFSINPVITPVVDMTNVNNSVRQINEAFGRTGNGYKSAFDFRPSSLSGIGNIGQNVQNVTENKNTYSNDSYTVNVYPSAEVDEEGVANLVVDKIIRLGAGGR